VEQCKEITVVTVEVGMQLLHLYIPHRLTGLDEVYQQMAIDQDAIGWRRFMEGMVCSRMRKIQSLYHFKEGTRITPERWTKGLILKLLEATHGQWLYRNVQIHDSVAGTQATLRKEEIQREIEEQIFRSLYERELTGNFGLFLIYQPRFPWRNSSLVFSLLAELDCIESTSPSLLRK